MAWGAGCKGRHPRDLADTVEAPDFTWRAECLESRSTRPGRCSPEPLPDRIRSAAESANGIS